MSRILVVHYSRTGTTRRVAQAIAQALGADVEELAEPRGRDGRRGYLRSVVDAVFRRLTELEPPKHRLQDYDLVVFGSPVWSASVSAPMRTYLARHRYELGKVALFCTCGGSGGERVLRQMAELCRKKPAATLILRQIEVERGSFRPKVDRFARAIEETLAEVARERKMPAPPPRTAELPTSHGHAR